MRISFFRGTTYIYCGPSINKTKDTEGAHINTVEAIKGIVNSKDKLQVNKGIIFPFGKKIEPKSRRDFDPQRNGENSLSR